MKKRRICCRLKREPTKRWPSSSQRQGLEEAQPPTTATCIAARSHTMAT